ncbi:hypothetical protein RIF29_30370 [Crotalaria pallida]|uniref:3'-5' exonuclease domain-containing protein n=1 Tax=Crotalaria pallida TaxID=3830 RepID=A0AAN9HWZ0_CROPI
MNHHHRNPHSQPPVYEVPTIFTDDDFPAFSTPLIFPCTRPLTNYTVIEPTVFRNPNPRPVYHPPTIIPVYEPPSHFRNPNLPTNSSVSVPTDNYITIIDHSLPYDTHNLYDVTFHSHSIRTLVTSSPPHVDSWISQTLNLYPNYRRNLIVGLDVEWRPTFSANSTNPVAIIQLCVADRCLIFQILHAPSIPRSLASFLVDARNTFVGVGIKEDAEKLMRDYNLRVGNTVDLRGVAADYYGDRGLKQAGIKTLSLKVLGLEVEKPKRVSMSRWDDRWLTAKQVQYACVDAFVSYEVGRRLVGV